MVVGKTASIARLFPANGPPGRRAATRPGPPILSEIGNRSPGRAARPSRKILRVIASMDPRTGGPSEGLRQVSRVLDAEGHRTEVACLDAPDDPWLRESPWPVHALGPFVGSYRYSGRFLPWLRSHIARFDC